MKICIAQTKSFKGQIEKSISNHLGIIESASKHGGELIIFPELSITGYEPELAEELATGADDPIFNSIQTVSDKNNITVGIGMPLKSDNGIHISMLIFRPHHTNRIVYSKRILHQDELPYFTPGINQPLLIIKNKTIALGICYETLQREHLLKARDNKAHMFIASVAKPERGTNAAYLHFPAMAKEINIPILMSNSVGYCDNFISNGNSSVWDETGQLIGQLNSSHQGIIIYDTIRNNITTIQHKEA